MKKIFLCSMAISLSFMAASVVSSAGNEDQDGTEQRALRQPHVSAEMLCRSDLPFSLALRSYDTKQDITLSSGQALRLERSDVERGRQHIPVDVLFTGYEAHWYERQGERYLHISYTSSDNPHWRRKFLSPFELDEQYWGREVMERHSDYLYRCIDFEFRLVDASRGERDVLSLREGRCWPWLRPDIQSVIPLDQHESHLRSGLPVETQDGLVKVVNLGRTFDLPGWGDFVTHPEDPYLKLVRQLLDKGWTVTYSRHSSGEVDDLFRVNNDEEKGRVEKERFLSAARQAHWKVLTADLVFQPPRDTGASEQLSPSQQSVILRSRTGEMLREQPLNVTYRLLVKFFPSEDFSLKAAHWRRTGERFLEPSSDLPSSPSWETLSREGDMSEVFSPLALFQREGMLGSFRQVIGRADSAQSATADKR